MPFQSSSIQKNSDVHIVVLYSARLIIITFARIPDSDVNQDVMSANQTPGLRVFPRSDAPTKYDIAVSDALDMQSVVDELKRMLGQDHGLTVKVE